MQSLQRAIVFRQAGYEVTVCCYYEYDKEMIERFENEGVQVLLLKLHRRDGRQTIRELAILLQRLVLLFKGMTINLLDVQYVAPGIIPLIAAKLARVTPVVTTMHTAGAWAYGKNARRFAALAAKLSTVVVCVSREVERFWFGESAVFSDVNQVRNRKHWTIYNGVHIEEGMVQQKPRHFQIEEQMQEKIIIGSVGRLVKGKGYDVLVRAMKTVVETHHNSLLVIIGEGPEQKSLQELSDALNIKRSVMLIGGQTKKHIAEYLSLFTIYVQPSYFEGFGITAAEAMAAGVPIIVSDTGGLKELVPDAEVGKRFPPGDHETLSHIIIELLNNPQAAASLGTAGRTRIFNEFSGKRYTATVNAFYRQLIVHR
jgi:glycosyltransferase involved in cell wall biosynthesis